MGANRAAGLVLVMGLVWGCSASDGLEVTMAEYTVEVAAEVEGGAATLRVRNVGAIDHELAVLETDRDPADLPLQDAEVQTDARGIREVGSTDRIGAGEEAMLTLRLRPGRYALICNVPGHYQSGMYTGMRVV